MVDFKNIFLFANLNDEEIEEIKKFTLIKKLKKDDIVFYEKENSAYLHILYEGVAKIYKVDPKGNELVIHKFSAPNLIAELATIEEFPFPANCKMETDGIVLKVEFEKFKRFLKNGELCFEIMTSLLKKMRFLDKVIHDNLILDTETKIAKFIYDNPDDFEKLKKHSIASILNIKPETLSRKLKKLKELGIINEKLKVTDREKIREFYSW